MREVDVMFGQKMLSMSTLGIAYALNGNKEKANKIAAHIANYETDLTGESYKKSYLGQIYMAMGAYEGCLRIVSEPRYTDQFLKVVMTVSLDVAGANWIKYQEISIHFMKSKCLLETHNIKKAKSGYDRLLGFKHIKSSGSLYWQILADRGRICVIENEYEQGIKYLKQAVEVIEKYRASINTEATKIGFVGNKQEVYGNLVNILIKTGRYSEAFIYAERGKARALVDLLASKKYFGDRNKTDREGQKNMLIDLETYEMQSIVQDYRITQEERVHARSLIVSQKNNIRQADPQLASLVTVMPPNIAETQNLLSPEDTILEYFGFGDKLFVFVVSNEKVHGLKLESEGLKNDIEIFRSHIMDPKSDRFFEQSKILFEKLVRPIEGMLNSKNLTIVPHGPLHYLPFNALISNGEYLIDRYRIRVLPSASVLKFLQDHEIEPINNLLVSGNPDLGDQSYDLPYAQKEALLITKDKTKSKMLLRHQASETAAKNYSSQFKLVHFACHGTFNPEKPLESGLMLSEDGKNDGILTVGEIYELFLPVNLVTLSACETGLGRVANGDDVVGFTRGFLYAGAKSIVSSLWKVDDKATSILMQQFYKSLNQKDKRSALRTAQLLVKDTYSTHPYYWAAFQITGSTH